MNSRELNPGRREMVTVVDMALPVAQRDRDASPRDCATSRPGLTRPLLAAEVIAIGVGRRLYNDGTIGSDATVLTVLNFTDALLPPERRALHEIGERSFGICARAGVLYQQAAELLSVLR